jgi:hypothetical protein
VPYVRQCSSNIQQTDFELVEEQTACEIKKEQKNKVLHTESGGFKNRKKKKTHKKGMRSHRLDGERE